jgi:hypothetical protein
MYPKWTVAISECGPDEIESFCCASGSTSNNWDFMSRIASQGLQQAIRRSKILAALFCYGVTKHITDCRNCRDRVFFWDDKFRKWGLPPNRGPGKLLMVGVRDFADLRPKIRQIYLPFWRI